MKPYIAILIVSFLVVGCIAENNTEASEMKLTSPAFTHGGFIPKKYTCDGQNVNPPLTIRDVPQGTHQLILIVDDPDAPSGTFTHWVEFFSASTKEIAENTKTDSGNLWGRVNDFGKVGYGGPCPPQGKPHTYRLKLYAVKQILWPTTTTRPLGREIEPWIKRSFNDKILATAELQGKYGR